MPQTDLMGFPSTIFFLLLTFIGGYVVFVSYILPELLLISKVRNFLLNLNLVKNTSKFNSLDKIEYSLEKEKHFLNKLDAYKLYSSFFIFYSLEDLLLAVNFLNLIFVLYFVLKSQIIDNQLESSKLLVKPLSDLKLSTYKLDESVKSYELLGQNLRSDILKPILFQYHLWNKNRENLFFKPLSFQLFRITTSILEEQRLSFQFEKNKRLYSQFQTLKQKLDANNDNNKKK